MFCLRTIVQHGVPKNPYSWTVLLIQSAKSLSLIPLCLSSAGAFREQNVSSIGECTHYYITGFIGIQYAHKEHRKVLLFI